MPIKIEPDTFYLRKDLLQLASESTLIRWEKKNLLCHYNVGRVVFYKGSDLLELLEQSKSNISAKIETEDASLMIESETSETETEQLDSHLDWKLQNSPYLNKNVDELELSVRSYNAMKYLKAQTVRDLLDFSDNDFLKLKNFSRKSLNEIKDILHSMGLEDVRQELARIRRY